MSTGETFASCVETYIRTWRPLSIQLTSTERIQVLRSIIVVSTGSTEVCHLKRVTTLGLLHTLIITANIRGTTTLPASCTGLLDQLPGLLWATSQYCICQTHSNFLAFKRLRSLKVHQSLACTNVLRSQFDRKGIS